MKARHWRSKRTHVSQAEGYAADSSLLMFAEEGVLIGPEELTSGGEALCADTSSEGAEQYDMRYEAQRGSRMD